MCFKVKRRLVKLNWPEAGLDSAALEPTLFPSPAPERRVYTIGSLPLRLTPTPMQSPQTPASDRRIARGGICLALLFTLALPALSIRAAWFWSRRISRNA